MKLMRYSILTVVAAGLLGGLASGQSWGPRFSGEGDVLSTLAIKTDGSCALTNEMVQQRKPLEMQVVAWERYSKRAEGSESEDENAAPAPSQPTKPEQKALTNEELASKIRAMYEQRNDSAAEAGQEIEKLEVSTNSVRVVTRHSFASLKELLSQSVYSWGPSLLMFEDARFETDTNQNLRITFTPSRNEARYSKEMSRAWKAAKMKFEWKLVLPGKILSSGLPSTEDSATWVRLDGEKPEMVDAVLKLIAVPLVITAEPGGITLNEPLVSSKLVRAAWRESRSEPNLPITEAEPGFQAEQVGLSLTTIHYFPEGKEQLKHHPTASMYGPESPGTMVSAKLFPPKGRIIRSVSDVCVKAAKDDKGRPILGVADGGDDTESYRDFSYNSDEQEKSGPARLQLRLGLPAPDAKTIEDLDCEAVALTIGGWKEMLLTNVQADAQKEIDLSEVLPGAKLIIKRISGKKPHTVIEARLEGPAAVSQLEVKVKLSSRRGGSSNVSNQKSSTSGGKTTRNFTLQSYEFEPGEMGKSSPPTLLVRYPQDVKRERVHFKLSTLDLL
jgi:hypothetical protein